MGQQLLPEGASPSTPAAGYVSIYAKTDGKIYSKDDAGTETVITHDAALYALLAGSASQTFAVATATADTHAVPKLQLDTAIATVSTTTEKLPAGTCTQAGGALTFVMPACTYDFRNPTLTSGAVTQVSGTPADLVLPSGGTLGSVTTVSARIVRLLINNAGTMEQAIINISGGNDLSETGVISTTAIGTGSDSANVFYSTTARTNVAYRVVGTVDAVNTAGAWGSPTLVQGAAGNALINMQTTSMVRLNTANGYGSTNTKIRRFTNVVVNQGSDITYADSATLGSSFTINTSGRYAVVYSDNFASASQIGISLNTTQPTTSISAITVADILALSGTSAAAYSVNCTVTAYLLAGSIIRPHNDGVAASSNPVLFTITRVG